jgi:hypothetical protein
MGVFMSACVLAKADLSENTVDFIDKLIPSVQSRYNKIEQECQKINDGGNWVDSISLELDKSKIFLMDLFMPIYKSYYAIELTLTDIKLFLNEMTMNFLKGGFSDVLSNDFREALLYALCKFFDMDYSSNDVLKALNILQGIYDNVYIIACNYCRLPISFIINDCKKSTFFTMIYSGINMGNCLYDLFLDVNMWLKDMSSNNDLSIYSDVVLENVEMAMGA